MTTFLVIRGCPRTDISLQFCGAFFYLPSMWMYYTFIVPIGEWGIEDFNPIWITALQQNTQVWRNYIWWVHYWRIEVTLLCEDFISFWRIAYTTLASFALFMWIFYGFSFTDFPFHTLMTFFGVLLHFLHWALLLTFRFSSDYAYYWLYVTSSGCYVVLFIFLGFCVFSRVLWRNSFFGRFFLGPTPQSCVL